MAGKRQALGMGLGALFEDNIYPVPVTQENPPGTGSKIKSGSSAGSLNPAAVESVLYIEIDEIKPNPENPRQSFDSEGIDELAASIEELGLIEPVILRKAKAGYELVAGERRWRAMRKLGHKTVPSIIREVKDSELPLIALVENMQREDINTIEEAMAYRSIIGKYRITQEGLGRLVGKSRPHIANTLRTLTLPPETQELLRTGVLTLGHANAIGSIKDVKRKTRLAADAAAKGLSVRETERLAAALAGKKPAKKKDQPRTNEIRIIEHELTSATGVKVTIKGDDEKGWVELRYTGRHGLEEIIDLLRKAGARTE